MDQGKLWDARDPTPERADLLSLRPASRRKGIHTRDGQAPRQSHDWYPTPASYREALRALLPMLPEGIEKTWEPAAGEGQLMDTLASFGLTVWGSDIRPGRDDIAPLDFLARERSVVPGPVGAPAMIVTNPPFQYLDAFIARCLTYLDIRQTGVKAAVLFLPWTSIAADRRTEAICRASVILRMPWRTRFFKPADGRYTPAGTADFCWVLWTRIRPELGPVLVTVPKPPTTARHRDGEPV